MHGYDRVKLATEWERDLFRLFLVNINKLFLIMT